MQHLLSNIKQVHGVDFSGAKDAGRRIWVASGVIEGDTLRIECCQRADGLPGSGQGRDLCLAALRDFIARQGACAIGLDFPFGLPRDLTGQDSWEDFVRAFPGDYPSPDQFRNACRAAARGREEKRITDQEAQTPFSPYNLWLYRQTFYGIRDVLRPLVQENKACILPMQNAVPEKPWVLEICPASTLKQEGLYWPYKDKADTRYAARKRILEGLKALRVSIPTQEVRSAVVENPGGDALDSVVAALATFRALRNPNLLTVERNSIYAIEGYVYV